MATEYSIAPALLSLRAAINARWPDRRKSTDGFIGDAAHFDGVKPGQKPGGEHVPTDEFGYYRTDGIVRAGDFDCRRADGTEFGDELVQLLVADGKARGRIAYVIHEGTIYSRNNGWRPARNSGHDTWVHVSLRNEVSSGGNTTPADVIAAAADTSPWFEDDQGIEVDMDWPKCMPFAYNSWVEVATPAGLKARTAPLVAPSTELRRNGKLVTVGPGYDIRVKACAFVDGIWWIRGGAYWYAACDAAGKLYLRRRVA